MDTKYCEWCPDCEAETGYDEPQPFKCPECGRTLLPCDACLQERGVDGVGCGACPWEKKQSEQALSVEPVQATGGAKNE